MGEAAPVKGIMSLGQQAAGAAGGKGGGGSQGQGVTPQEAALAQYSQHQNQMQVLANFGQSGMGHSTNATQAVGGTRIAEALQLAGMSDANQQATQQGLQQLAEQQGAQAGEAAGQGNQGFSSSPGNFGDAPNTTGQTASA